MKRPQLISLLLFAMTIRGYTQHIRGELLKDLQQRQQQEHSAIGWVDAGRLEFIVFNEKPSLHTHVLAGPNMWSASVSRDQTVGGIQSDSGRSLAAVQDGKIIWQNRDLVLQQPPEISPSGKLILLEGIVKKKDMRGLFLVADHGNDVIQVSPSGKNPAWSSDDSKLIYESEGHIYVYEVRSKEQQAIGEGTMPTWSPDGKWITFKTPNNQFVLSDATGRVQRTLFEGKRVLTPLRWSPDSAFLMYVDNRKPGCNSVKVYRLRDSQSADVYQICEGYPYWMLRWVRLPAIVPLR